MKKILFLTFVLFGLFSEVPSFAAAQKYISHYKVISTKDISSFEEYCHESINKIRQQHGMRLLNRWPQLSDCAREHSQNMAQNKCPFGHDGFEKRAKHMQKAAKLISFGENVAYSFGYEDPVKLAVDSWMDSQGHRENILADFEETGIGVAITKEGKFYITQLFAKRR